MAQKTFHIELRCINIPDEAVFNVVKEAAKRAARELHAAAMLVCPGETPPQILLYGEDFLSGKEDITKSLTEDETTEE